MRRIGLAVVLAFSLFLAPLAAEAQPSGSVRRIGYLAPGWAEADREFLEELRRGLRERGYVEGQNLHVEYRQAEGKVDRLPGLVTDLIGLRVELIVARASAAALAAHQATRTIPIVMVAVGNPVELGLAASLARPGGNVTGFTSYGPNLTGKQLEHIREAVPDMKRLAVLWTPGNPLHPGVLRDLEELTRSRGIQIQSLKIVTPDEIEGALRAAATGHAAAVWVVGDAMFSANSLRIATLAMNARLPTCFFWRGFVEAGGLMSYAPDFNHMYFQTATHVDKILKGVKPAEIPIEEPTKFELVINLKTAKALGLTIPQSLLVRADEVIQ